jgi:hypothetical protein
MSKMTESRLACNRYDEQDWNIQYVFAVRNSDAARTAHLRIIAGSALEALDDACDRGTIGTAAAIADLPHVAHQGGRAGTMTHDYKRHGTTTLFAALNDERRIDLVAGHGDPCASDPRRNPCVYSWRRDFPYRHVDNPFRGGGGPDSIVLVYETLMKPDGNGTAAGDAHQQSSPGSAPR